MITVEGWAVRHRSGSPDDVHTWSAPAAAAPTLDLIEVDHAAIVLGSAQDAETLDVAAVERAGVVTVRRRSGGGAVLLQPGRHVWTDVWLPRGDRRWDDDVVGASGWLGTVWRLTAVDLGFDAVRIHDGPASRDAWARAVCFAGAGPGEVFVGDRKLVGLSQRRTRDWVRFSCLVHRSWDAATTFGLIDRPGRDDAVSTYADAVVAVGDRDVVAAFGRRLALS